MNLELKYKNYPFSKELVKFMGSHNIFYKSLKLFNEQRFYCLPIIFTSHTPSHHKLTKDEIIGIWYLDITNYKKRQKPYFKQDFIVNKDKKNKTFIAYSASKSSRCVQPIKQFFKSYGSNGRYYHNGKKWQHHYNTVRNLPREPKLRQQAKLAISKIR